MSGIMYASYTVSALCGAPSSISNCRGSSSSSRNGLALGMAMCASYVAAFFAASLMLAGDHDDADDVDGNYDGGDGGGESESPRING